MNLLNAVVFLLSVAAGGPVMVSPPEPIAPLGIPPVPGAPLPSVSSPSPDLLWVGEAVSDLLPRALGEAGVAAVSRDDRLREQAALEIPSVPLTLATSIRLAEALGAQRLVVGSYSIDGASVSLSLRLLDAPQGALGSPLTASGPLDTLCDLIYMLAFELARATGVTPALAKDDLLARRPSVSLGALRAYGQGLAARNVANKGRFLRRALAIDPSFEEARIAFARLQMEAGEFSAAHENLARIPAASPHARAARFLQGVAQIEVGRYQEASALYASLATESATPAVLNNRALAMLRGGIKDPAPSSLLRRAVSLEPASVDLAFNLAWALLLEDDPHGAEFVLRDLLSREPLDSQARVLLAWALRRAGRAKEAEEEWKGVVTLAPAYEGLATPDLSRRFERIQPGERLLALNRAARTPAEVAAGLIGKAERLTAAGDTKGAVRELERAAYLDPRADRIHLLLARAYRAEGLRDKAVNEYRMTLWGADDAAIRAELAAVLKEMGRMQEARAEAERALKANPANEAARRVLKP